MAKLSKRIIKGCFYLLVAASEIDGASKDSSRFLEASLFSAASDAKQLIVRNQGFESVAFVAFPARARRNNDEFPQRNRRPSSIISHSRFSELHLPLLGFGDENHDALRKTRLPSKCHTFSSTILFSQSIQNDNGFPQEGIRLNKVFKATHSRREADALIENGRVSVNGQKVVSKGGFKVIPFRDKVELDGKLIQGWESMNGIERKSSETTKAKQTKPGPSKISHSTTNFEYIKYWKPRGITCTTDRSIRSNIIDDLLRRRGYEPKHRVYPVGRLDKDTSGLILLTSDGRLPNSALRGRFKQPKVYHVLVHKMISEADLQQLRDGVVITTVAQRDGNRAKPLTAKTLPCQVERLPWTRQRGVSMTLVEGRNRQIRKMMAALGYEVVELHRVEFMGVTLDPLQKEGDWTELDNAEMSLVQDVLKQAAATAVDS